MSDDAEFFYQRFIEKFARQRDYNHQEAIADLIQAITLAPENMEYRLARGRRHYEMGEFAEAVVDLNEVIKQDTNLDNLAAAHGLCAISEERLGHPIRVVQHLDWLIDHEFAGENTCSWRALYHSRAGNNLEAISDLTHALELAPDTENILMPRATAYYRAEDYENALKDLTRILELESAQHPGFLRGVYFWLGKTYHKLGRNEEALNDFNEMMRLQGKEPLETLADYIDTVESG
ncbi:MAG TPA: tetratricopeptide repeat protein [Phototrophicaceae bacterium]|jgi:tetratricopeptide (TPR) repeat protein|nr:tetratricopeptide repeat protein [Phototrophicaceae bacterium]